MSKALAVSIKEMLHQVDELDLGPIVFKLVHPEPDVEGMSIAEAERSVMKYRRFLKLIATHPEQAIVPSKEIDEVWHTHILDTRKYAEDCQKIFGFFLHHFPYLGIRGEEDKQDWMENFMTTCDIYKDYFGEELQALSSESGQLPAGTCSGPCGGPDGDFAPRPRLTTTN